MVENAIGFLQLTGSPFDRGVMHGRTLGPLFASFWEAGFKDVSERVEHPMTEDELRAWLVESARTALQLSPDLDEEIHGMAEGAGVEYEVALGVALSEEVQHLAAALGSPRYAAPSPVQGRCLSILVPPEHSTTDGWLLGQTWDGADWLPDPYLFAIRERTGTQVYLGDAGMVGGPGVNEHGIGSVHTGVLIRDHPPGLPYTFISRRILQADDFEAAVESVSDAPTTAGCNYVVASSGRIVNVEAAADLHDEVIYHEAFGTCAHFVAGGVPQLVRPSPGSEFRVARVRQLMLERSPVSPIDLFQIMSDHEEGPDRATVCWHGAGLDSRSLASIVVDPESRRVWASAGTPCEGRPAREVSVAGPGIETRIVSLVRAA